MNPLSALGQAFHSAYNTGMNVTGKAVAGGLNVTDRVLGDFQDSLRPPQTRQLPQGMQSPVPQNQIVPHQSPPWLQQGINQVAHILAPQQRGFVAQPQEPKNGIIPAPQKNIPGAILNLNHNPNVVSPLGHTAILAHIQQRFGAPPQPTPTPQQPTPTPQMMPQSRGALPQQTVDFLEHNVFPITDGLGVPRALAASQWAVEGGRQITSPINNFYGIGPGWQFNNTQENVHTYANTVLNILKQKGYNPAQMNPTQMIQALQAGTKPRYEGHNANPQTYVDTVTNTPEWRYYQ